MGLPPGKSGRADQGKANQMMKKILKKLGAEDWKSFWELLWQFFKFGLVGLSNTAVSMGCYYLFLFLNEDWYMAGSIVGTIVSIANAFFWNDRYVFSGNENDWKSKLKRLGKTYISYGGTAILSNVMLWIEVVFFSVSKGIAPIVNLLVTIPLNFVINKFWTFRSGVEKNEREIS